MSEENVDAFRRATDAFNRRDIDAVLRELDPAIEWHPLLQALLRGEAAVFRGHEGAVALLRDVEDTFTELQADQSEFRDLGEQVVAIGHFRGRGRESGVMAETPIVWLVEFKSGKAIRIREYLDPKEALEAAGVSE